MIKVSENKLRHVHNWSEHAPNLSHIFLAGIDFSNQDLSGFNFTSAYLPEAQFENTILKDTIFTNAVLTRVNFTGSDLSNADFRESHLVGANLHDCTLKGADFRGALMESVTYPMNCNGFHGVKHSMENVQNLLALFQLVEGIDPELIKAISPWFNKDLRLPDSINAEKGTECLNPES